MQLPAVRSDGDLVRDDLTAAAVLLAAAGWTVFLLVRGFPARGGGRARPQRRRAESAGRVEWPDDPPAVAHALHNAGAPGPSLIGVLVLDLARRGHLDIFEERAGPTVSWRFRRKPRNQDGTGTSRGDLRPYENAVYTRLFAPGNDVTQASLTKWAEANRQQARVFLERVRRSVVAEMRERGYLERPRRLPAALNLVASGLVVLVGLAALFSGALAGLLAVASGAAQTSRTRTLRNPTLSAGGRAQQWAEVAHDLEEVADLEDPPATDPGGWERCLVYAAALGVADHFVAGLVHRDPRLLSNPGFAPWYRRAGEDAGERASEGAGAGLRLAGVARLAGSIGRDLAEAAERPSRMAIPAG